METLAMSRKERKRLEVFSRVQAGELTLSKASELLSLSYRQVKRSFARYREQGDAGLVHQARGRVSNRRTDVSRKAEVLGVYAEKYADYGPTLASECMAQDDKLVVAVTTLRRWLSAAGLWQRQRKRKVHRRRRARREQPGELVQMDGSHHDWFEGRREPAVLMVMVDDATGTMYARFFEEETLVAAWSTFWRYAELHGLPQALYVDRHGIYRSDREPTADELLADESPQTQFGRSMQELDVKLILARSPQAKGRVERMNRTLQDRLVKALRRAGISDLDSANAFLEGGFLSAFNAQFRVPAAQSGDLHRAVPADADLDRIFAVREPRVVQPDWTVRWQNRFLQLPRGSFKPGSQAAVFEQLNGALRVFVGDVESTWSATRSEPKQERKRVPQTGPSGSSQGQRPAMDHPWRRPFQGATRTPEVACDAPVR